jgi:hypothetical protein
VENVSYNSYVEYEGDTPLKDGESDWSRWEFVGWSPEVTVVTRDVDYYAQYKFTGSLARELVQRTIEGDYVNDRVTKVGTWSCNGCRALTSINLSSATIIEEGSLNNCSTLRSVSFPSVTTIAGYSMASAVSLTTIDLPKATSIGGEAFYNNPSLNTLILRNTDAVCYLGGANAFTGTAIAKRNGYIYVPKIMADGSDGVEAYKAATNWSTFADQIRAIEDYPDICGGEA